MPYRLRNAREPPIGADGGPFPIGGKARQIWEYCAHSGWGIGSLVPAVCQLECRITVYLPQEDGDLRRAVFVENGRRCYREADGSGDRGEAGLQACEGH